MPASGVRAHLAALYARSDDPWNTHSSAYEGRKFARTVGSLPRPRYRRCLEIGCGAGALTKRLASQCDMVVAMDCIPAALAVAKARVPETNVIFVEGAAPGCWPAVGPDLVVLSEVLYFLTEEESAGLASRLVSNCAEDCDVVLVNWLGDTNGPLGGAAAALRLVGALGGTHRRLASLDHGLFRIDVLHRAGGPCASHAGG